MMTRLFKILAASILLLGPGTLLADQTEQPADKTDIRYGAQAWVNNCARCHHLRRTDEFSDKDWVPIIGHMRIRAGLTGKEAREILRFLQSANDRS